MQLSELNSEVAEMDLDSQSLADIEQRHILLVLKHCNGNRTAAAKVLGLARSTLVLKLKSFNIGETAIV